MKSRASTAGGVVGWWNMSGKSLPTHLKNSKIVFSYLPGGCCKEGWVEGGGGNLNLPSEQLRARGTLKVVVVVCVGGAPRKLGCRQRAPGAPSCTGRERMKRGSCPEKAGGRGKRGRQRGEMAARGDQTACRSFGGFLFVQVEHPDSGGVL